MRSLLVATALLLPSAAGAQPSLSLRLGYAPSLGSAAAALPMSQVVGAQFPLQADALWRIGRLALGAYASWGPGVAGACDPGARCGASSTRLGLEGTVSFRPASASFDGWAGAGVGYEWTARRRRFAGSEVEWGYRGPEASLQGGADLLRRGRAAFGPFLLVALGRYTRLSLDTPVESGGGEIAGKRIHAWIEIGFRAKLDL